MEVRALPNEYRSDERPSDVPPSGVRVSPGPTRPLAPVSRGPGTYNRRQTAEERRAGQRQALVDAAARVFARDGFADASVAAIIDLAEMSRGTFYRNFRDLSDVFLAVRQSAADLAFDRVQAAISTVTDPIARVRAGLRAFLRLLAEHGDLARVFLREPPADGRAHEQLQRATVERFVGLWREGLQDALERGLVRKLPDEKMIYAVLHAIGGMAVRYVEMYQEARAIESEPVLFELCCRAFR